ncbi:energy transducer TonB [Pseudomonas mosselii]|uniref:energy transducer TonB n=1 Tax=Pseudomonas mosselii TaxID=78327 RepID=UPI0021D81673|nr:TonB family protein [Pseudomonas mosselii]MCU9528353.1 TonB family protein [Pseudomonas mosselii]MCU9535526.1 TonB family protein [Pseudomonas mosselii]MCU9543414.1 TonB family protein [Pseudomonas mosselii]MCU9547377.1 TonB family protein [Pseudomonas mosselii]
MSEKHLALLASTISMVLATMSATALIMVNSVRSDFNTQRESYAEASQKQALMLEAQNKQIQQLQAIVGQLKSNQLAMLPFLDPGRRHAPTEPAAGAELAHSAAPSEPLKTSSVQEQAQAPAVPAPRVTLPGQGIPVTIAKPSAPPRPAAPTPPGVKIFPAPESRLVAPPPAAETGAPQASATQADETILAALQTPTMGMKAHPVLEQVKAPAIVKEPRVTKRLENVDGILVERIISNWKRPASARNGMAVVIDIKMARDGGVRSATVVKSSGDKAFDQSATSAIKAVKAIPEMSQVSDSTYKQLYKERRVRFSPEDLSG